MTSVIPLGDGKQVVVSADKGVMRLSLWANKGMLGSELDRKAAIQLRTALMAAILEVEKAAASSG